MKFATFLDGRTLVTLCLVSGSAKTRQMSRETGRNVRQKICPRSSSSSRFGSPFCDKGERERERERERGRFRKTVVFCLVGFFFVLGFFFLGGGGEQRVISLAVNEMKKYQK